MSAWVEKGTPPPASTRYKVVDCQIELPPKAAKRRGHSAGGHADRERRRARRCRRRRAGDNSPASSRCRRAPAKSSVAEWDFEGAGDYPVAGQVKLTSASGSHATVTTTYTFSKPGTYFPALRVGIATQSRRTRPMRGS